MDLAADFLEERRAAPPDAALEPLLASWNERLNADLPEAARGTAVALVQPLLAAGHGSIAMSRGFTLVEQLVATVLFAMLGVGGFAAWARGNAAWHEASLEQVLNERAQYVFATLEPELQMAGYFGQAAAPTPLAPESIPLAAQDCGLALVQRLDRAVEVAAGYELPCAAGGSGAMNSSQQLTIRPRLAQLAAAVSGRAQWLGTATTGQLVWNDATGVQPAAGAERRDLLLRVYYVARAADGDARDACAAHEIPDQCRRQTGVHRYGGDARVSKPCKPNCCPTRTHRAACDSHSRCVRTRVSCALGRYGAHPSRASFALRNAATG